MYTFTFKGGTESGANAQTKYMFYLYAVCDGQEKTLSAAKREGYVVDSSCGSANTYNCRVPVVKVFMMRKGFGVRKSFLNFYIDLSKRTKRINIQGFNPDENRLFEGMGTFLNADQVGTLVGKTSESYKFFKVQSRLSVAELRKFVTVTNIVSRGPMRKLRI